MSQSQIKVSRQRFSILSSITVVVVELTSVQTNIQFIGAQLNVPMPAKNISDANLKVSRPRFSILSCIPVFVVELTSLQVHRCTDKCHNARKNISDANLKVSRLVLHPIFYVCGCCRADKCAIISSTRHCLCSPPLRIQNTANPSEGQKSPPRKNVQSF